MLVELIIATIIIIFIELYYQKSEVKENENNKMQQNEKIENPKSKIKELTNLDLLVGEDYQITDKICIKHPKLSDILEIGENTYNKYVSVLTMDTIHVADILYETYGIWYEDISDWQLFLDNFNNEYLSTNTKIIHDALKYFTGLDFTIGVQESNNEPILFSRETGAFINELIFKLISQFLKKINFMKDDEIYYQLRHAGSKGTAKYILKQISKKRKVEKSTVDLQSIVSSLLWKTGVGKEVFDWGIFAIYEGYSRLNAIDNWDKTVTAYYAGTIDTEKSQVNLDKINWSKILIK